MNLISLITDLPISWKCENALPELIITDVQFDSRKVKPGSLFVAIKGDTSDGHDYIHGAISNGAVAVVGSREISGLSVPYIKVENPRQALAYLAAAFFDHPASKMTMIGVTGTDGKTTTCNLIFEILKLAGYKMGLISTVNAVIGDEVIDTGFHVTTPEATDVQYYLSKMAAAGITHVVLETTSHGLVQHRVTGCDFDIAAVTNITHEHLDYHGSYEEYRDAKALLFSGVANSPVKSFAPLRFAVLNIDDSSFDHLSSVTRVRRIAYGLNGGGDITATGISSSPAGVDFIINWAGRSAKTHCNLPGKFNVSNCLAAASVALGLGVNLPTVVEGIASLEAVPGRMEAIELGQPFAAIVDFAHTPNALKVALETAREMTQSRVIAIFGSAGLRDREKRRMMAEVSTKLADISILTAEDPRTESLDAILSMMADAAKSAGGIEGKDFYRVPDRPDALRLAVKLAQPGDLVIACGKGHEQSMCFGTTEYPWDDRISMKAALADLLGIPGPAMPRLPTSS